MDTVKKKVLIIGAGASGLGAGRWLLDNDVSDRLDVHVIEARDRLGGRVHTSTEDAGAENIGALGLFDLGASWLHDPSPSNPLSAMAETLRAPLLVTDFENDETFNLQGQKFSDRETASQYRAFEKNLFAAAVQARKKPSEFRHLSLEQTVKNRMTEAKWGHPLMQLYASLFEFDLGASLEKCSSTECIDGDWIAAEMDDRAEDGDIDPIFPVTGFGVIIDGLVSGDATDNRLLRPDVSKFPVLPGAQKVTYTARKPMKISLNTRVFEVVQSDGRCVVTAMAGEQMREWEADAVICTLPVGVLQARSIRFSPELSLAKTAAIDAIGSGNVVKIIMEFSKVFWDTHLSFLGIADATLCGGTDGRQQRGLCTFFMNGHKACKRKILITYAVGDGADIADSMSDDALLDLCMSRVRCFVRPGQTAHLPTKFLRTRWSSDPYALGAYSYWTKGSEPGLRAELRLPEGNVWLAGEAVHESSLQSSSVCGAWISGVAAAADVCRRLDVPIITPVF